MFDADGDEDQYHDLLLLIQLLKHILAKDFTFGFPVSEGIYTQNIINKIEYG